MLVTRLPAFFPQASTHVMSAEEQLWQLAKPHMLRRTKEHVGLLGGVQDGVMMAKQLPPRTEPLDLIVCVCVCSWFCVRVCVCVCVCSVALLATSGEALKAKQRKTALGGGPGLLGKQVLQVQC